MIKIRLVALLMVIQIHVLAQKNHFIAIQSENKQSYYARIGTNVFNSTPTGHLIIPRLTDSTYIITIGFSKKTVGEEKFSITITKDVGFILRIAKDKGLILSNSQTAQIITPVKQLEQVFTFKDSSTNNSKKDEDFAKLMSQVVNDSAVMENTFVAEEPKKEEPKKEIVKNETPTKPIIKIDSSAASDLTKKKNEDLLRKKSDTSSVVIKKKNEDSLRKKVAVVKTPEKKEKVLQPKAQKSIVRKLSEQKTDSVIELVYEDFIYEGRKDTIHIIIPLDSNLVIKKPIATTSIRNENIKKDSTIIPEIKPETKADTPLFRPVAINNNCKNTATDYDVDKLRVKMLAIEDEDDKISTAKKIFKTKCFSTNQISALSEVFSTDAGKYKLFDAAYSYVSDVNNFTRLQSLMKDEYYITRFKAMIK